MLSLKDRNIFVGDDIRFTCESQVQRWPIGVNPRLDYMFVGFRRGKKEQDGTLLINNVSSQDTGSNISCSAVDDLGMKSEQSNIITLNIFCKFHSFILYAFK